MVRKNKEDNNNYHKKYYHDKGLKKVQSDRARLNYWRKKLIKLLHISPNCEITNSAINKLSESRLRKECKKIKLNMGRV